jgi:CBS domain-containing protein
MQPDRKGNEAAMGMARDGYGKVFVCDEEGRLLGLVTKTDIMSVMRERQEYEKTAAK